jgi:hypothetical protein
MRETRASFEAHASLSAAYTRPRSFVMVYTVWMMRVLKSIKALGSQFDILYGVP